jgi:F-type H+-transporting ATPase subunit b
LLIDWFTVLAQAFNFVILVFLLKRFLYGPIIRAMEAREKRIAAAMEQARAAEREARERAETLAGERQAFADAKNRLLAEAREGVREWRRNALEDVKREVEALRRSWAARLNEDREAFLRKLKVQVAGQVLRISDKVLRDLADESVENRLVSVLVDALSRERAGVPADEISGNVHVQSGFPLSPSRSDALRRRILQTFPRTKTVSFEAFPDLGIGLRLAAGDRKVEWNLTHYLEELEKEVLTELYASARETK